MPALKLCQIAVASAVSALAFIAPLPAIAHSVPEGQCLPREQMVARMQAEEQRVLVTAAAMTDGAMQPLAAGIAYSFSANSNGSEGYELTTEQDGAMLCVRQHLTNIRIADPSRQQVVPFYMEGTVPDEEARAIGRRVGATYVGHNAMLDEGAGRNAYPILHALKGDGALYILTWPERETSVVFQGAQQGMMGMRHFAQNTQLTAYGKSLLDSGAIWPRRD